MFFFPTAKDVPDGKVGGSSRDVDRGAQTVIGIAHHAEIHQATSKTSVFTSSTKVVNIEYRLRTKPRLDFFLFILSLIFMVLIEWFCITQVNRKSPKISLASFRLRRHVVLFK